MTLVLSKTTFAQSVSHKFFLKEQIEVPSILLTTQTNLGKFKNALSVSTHALGQIVRIFCQVVVLFSFYTKDSNFLHFVVVHTVLHKYRKFEDVSTFLN